MEPVPPASDPVAAVADAFAGGGDVRLINPSAGLLAAVVDRTHATTTDGVLHLVVTGSVREATEDRFPTAAQLADLCAAGRAAVDVSGEHLEGTLCGGAVVGMVFAQAGEWALLPLEAEPWRDWIDQTWRGVVAGAGTMQLPEMGYDRLRSTLAAGVSPPVAVHFDRLVSTARRHLADDADIDPTAVALLATAYHGGQLAEVTAWGIEAGVASRATFSRVKSQLVETGVIETAPIPQEVGRPRLRLQLRQPAADTDAAALIDAARAVIA